jgi:uncharacterized short protein YbdD (DUF466 family)
MTKLAHLWACELSSLRGRSVPELLYTLRANCLLFAKALRQVIGAPDYQRYVRHVHARHPGIEPLAPDEFYRARLEDRYSKPGARCC